ncbi:cryptochrome/photolyase family protein [Marivirga lumbricoides]|uniref:Cryptochrome/photolyase family protein n=1 Tax=Marivirga lumbricoides TaxID=1046115 RepID=A0ABQ1N5R7_9BACT|nr:cryptochrome/photolyase family protein [Marivirga lumbricoides]
MKTLRLILGDQLNQQHSWFQERNDEVTYVMMEMRQETDYVVHHIQKITAFFAAMRLFKTYLEEKNQNIIYLSINDSKNEQSLEKNLLSLIEKHQFKKFEYLLPDEYRLDEQLKSLCKKLEIRTGFKDTEHFYTEREDVADFFKGKKQLIMENFYRMMRKKHNILMEGNEPLGGKWNFDEENRKKYKGEVPIPEAYSYKTDVSDLVKEIKQSGCKYFGEVDPENFHWPLERSQALQFVRYFCKKLLPNFGKYQDAMHSKYKFLFHARISFALNSKMITPAEVVEKVLYYWKEDEGKINIAQVEGFIRQIIGWREFMRGIYWAKMPEYASKNYFDHTRKLPSYYWSGDTKMNCVKQAVKQTLTDAYAHHIQRLMVTGNFALLNMTDPNEVDAWYLGVYIDAIEWVEITNTRGMSQFADGGIIGTKPYISSANYVHKMSNYCSKCFYNHKAKYGEKACPFNSLYWNFYDAHREKLEKNQRVVMMYRTWDKKPKEEKTKILTQAAQYLKEIDQL